MPIVALTAQAFAGQAQLCRAAGMDGPLVKPLMLAPLLETVQRVAEAGRAAAAAPSAVPSSASSHDVAVLDLDLPVLNQPAFDATTGYRPPAAVVSYLQTLLEQGGTLLRDLSAPVALASAADRLADAAHKLAGSAGLFGFERLASAGRYYEHAVQNDSPEAPALARSLGSALEATLEELRDRMVVEKH